MTARTELVDLGPLDAEQRAELEGGEEFPFGTLGADLEWRPKDRYVVLRDAEGRLLASSATVLAEVSVGGGAAFPVVGIGGVIVAPAHRGRGVLRPVLKAALERAARRGPDHAVLFCRPELVAMYERFGFTALPRPVRVDQPAGPVEIPQETMWRPLRAGATWPPGPVRVLGLPF